MPRLLLGALATEVPVWPLEDNPVQSGAPLASFLQPTASGLVPSALFGCVRNDGERFHEGLDIGPQLPRRGREATDPVRAIQPGRVTYINRVAGNSSYGRYVVIEHGTAAPAFYSLYAHLARIDDGIAEGQAVEQGAVLGVMGRSAGGYYIPPSRAHLHLEVGLRLTDDFDGWFKRQGYTSENHHGKFNGINLIGWDPLDYFQKFADGSVYDTASYLRSIPPGVLLHVKSPGKPEILERYPALEIPGSEASQRAGWEVTLSAWGLPLSFRALGSTELDGVRRTGDISVIAVNGEALETYACRDITTTRSGRTYLGNGGRRVLELLFHGAR
jgi:hypothetical protein